MTAKTNALYIIGPFPERTTKLDLVGSSREVKVHLRQKFVSLIAKYNYWTT